MAEDKLLKELNHYRKIFGVGDLATRAYSKVVKMIEQQVDFLDSFELKTKITSAAKDDPVYGRAKEIWEELPDMILKLNKLKIELDIQYVEKEEEMQGISAKQIADGNVH